MLKDKFPDIILWHCLNHRLEPAGETKAGNKEQRTKRELNKCSYELQITLKRIGKVFTVRWVASFFRAVSAVWQFFLALSQHFHKASNDETRKCTKKVTFQGCISFIKNLALIARLIMRPDFNGTVPIF